MDFLVFPDVEQTSGYYDVYPFEGAYVLNDITSATWIERYRDAGEFELVGPAHGELRRRLRVGDLLSHIDTQEVMIVETHEITENKENNYMEIKITGRSFETFLENRVVNQDKFRHNFASGNFYGNLGSVEIQSTDTSVDTYPYRVTSNANVANGQSTFGVPRSRHAADRATHLIKQAIFLNDQTVSNGTSGSTSHVWNPPPNNWDKVPWVTPVNAHIQEIGPNDLWNIMSGGFILDGGGSYFVVEPGDIYSAVLKILDEDGLGIKSHRPGPSSPITLDIPTPWDNKYDRTLALVVYHGNDRRKEITFSYAGGDIQEVEYVQSIKNYKNTVYMKSQFSSYILRTESTPEDVANFATGYSQRAFRVEVDDVDAGYVGTSDSVATQDQKRTWITERYVNRGRSLLKLLKNRKTTVSGAKMMSQQGTQFGNVHFRREYDTGDLVTVVGSDGEKRSMMVSEHVEIEDEKGEYSQPVLMEPNWGSEIY